MDCVRIRELVSACLDEEEAPDERVAVEVHLAGCAACRRAADGMALVSRLARMSLSHPEPDLAGRRLAPQRDPRTPAGTIGPAEPARGCDNGLHLVGTSSCGCSRRCECGCQDGRSCRCGPVAA